MNKDTVILQEDKQKIEVFLLLRESGRSKTKELFIIIIIVLDHFKFKNILARLCLWEKNTTERGNVTFFRCFLLK